MSRRLNIELRGFTDNQVIICGKELDVRWYGGRIMVFSKLNKPMKRGRKPQERHIPTYCKKKFHLNLEKDNKICCNCGSPNIIWQEGDGKQLHSLCESCKSKVGGNEK